MKVINIMNFVRRCDPRVEDSEDILYETTRRELELVRELGLPSTFLLQYDALTDRRYQELFPGWNTYTLPTVSALFRTLRNQKITNR